MPLRRRLTLVSAAAVGVAIAIAVVVSYLAVRHELRGGVDAGLRGDAASLQHFEASPLAAGEPGPPPDLVRPAPFGGEARRFPKLGVSRRGGPSPYVQVLRSNGTVERLLGTGP